MKPCSMCALHERGIPPSLYLFSSETRARVSIYCSCSDELSLAFSCAVLRASPAHAVYMSFLIAPCTHISFLEVHVLHAMEAAIATFKIMYGEQSFPVALIAQI